MPWVPAPTDFKQPYNNDGSEVDPSLYNQLTGRPLYTYYYPEQWNPKNPEYPFPAYPNRIPPPTQAEIDAAAEEFANSDDFNVYTNQIVEGTPIYNF